MHYNGSNNFIFQDSKIKKYPFRSGNTSKDFTANNIKKQD